MCELAPSELTVRRATNTRSGYRSGVVGSVGKEMMLLHNQLIGSEHCNPVLCRQRPRPGASEKYTLRKAAHKSTAPETDAVKDHVRRDFTADAPNQVWFADITYMPTWKGWLFLAVVMDACTKRIVGWSMTDDLKSDIVVDALGMGTTMRRPIAGLVHHSDRGAQYRSLAFGTSLRDWHRWARPVCRTTTRSPSRRWRRSRMSACTVTPSRRGTRLASRSLAARDAAIPG